MRRWLWTLIKRFVTFFIALVAFVQALSYVLGADDEVKKIALEYQGTTAVLIGLGALVFAMYDWMERDEP